MPHLLLTCNVGSLGMHKDGHTPREVSDVRRRLFETLTTVKKDFGRYPDSVGLQETRTYNMQLAPAYGLPVSCDDNVFVRGLNGQNVARGVCTYALHPGNASTLTPLDSTTEITTTIYNTRFNGGSGERDHKVAFLNVYRLRNANAECTTLRDIQDYIQIQCEKLQREQSVRKVIVHGDFNAENFTMAG